MSDKEFQEYKEKMENKRYCAKCLKELKDSSLDNFCSVFCSKDYTDEIKKDQHNLADYI